MGYVQRGFVWLQGRRGFEPSLETCKGCHADAENFDINGYLTKFGEDYKALEEALVAKGVLTANADGTYATVPGNYDTALAQALFFYNTVHEDGSEGIHNPTYFKALMENALAAVK